MLLRDLTIENYRSFDKYRLDNLARVNLLVGDNNCGKTSVLEAVHILAANGKFSCVTETLELREAIAGRRKLPSGKEDDIPDVLALILRRDLSNGSDAVPEFRVSTSNRDKCVTFSVILEDGDVSEVRTSASSGGHAYRYEFTRVDGQRLRPPSMPNDKPPFDKEKSAELLRIPNHVFVSSRGLSSSRLAALWARLLHERREHFVESALSLIDPRIERILITPNARVRSNILFDRPDGRVSAADAGEGLSFTLSISVAIASSQGGVAMIDEIDTGLHYSRLPDMWRMVIQSAKDLDVQVFATTHSLDCLNALRETLVAHGDFAEEVAVHRIERSIDRAVTLTGQEFVRAMKRESEIR